MYPDVSSLEQLANPAKVTITVDTSALFTAGLAPSYVDVYWYGRDDGQTSTSVSSSDQSVSSTNNITAPGTYDFVFQAKTATGNLIIEELETDVQLWPGEEITLVSCCRQWLCRGARRYF